MPIRPVLLLALILACAAPALARLPARVPLIGYVDRTGKVVEPATYDRASLGFVGDWVAVSRDGKAGYLNLRTRASTGTHLRSGRRRLLARAVRPRPGAGADRI